MRCVRFDGRAARAHQHEHENEIYQSLQERERTFGCLDRIGLEEMVDAFVFRWQIVVARGTRPHYITLLDLLLLLLLRLLLFFVISGLDL